MYAIQSFLKALPGPDTPTPKIPSTLSGEGWGEGVQIPPSPYTHLPFVSRDFSNESTPKFPPLRHDSFSKTNPSTPHYPHHHGHRPPSRTHPPALRLPSSPRPAASEVCADRVSFQGTAHPATCRRSPPLRRTAPATGASSTSTQYESESGKRRGPTVPTVCSNGWPLLRTPIGSHLHDGSPPHHRLFSAFASVV